jgi:hypothetical protein
MKKNFTAKAQRTPRFLLRDLCVSAVIRHYYEKGNLAQE